jgi:hypothetical protein
MIGSTFYFAARGGTFAKCVTGRRGKRRHIRTAVRLHAQVGKKFDKAFKRRVQSLEVVLAFA